MPDEDLSKQEWTLKMDGYQVALLMAVLTALVAEHPEDMNMELLKELRPVRTK